MQKKPHRKPHVILRGTRSCESVGTSRTLFFTSHGMAKVWRTWFLSVSLWVHHAVLLFVALCILCCSASLACCLPVALCVSVSRSVRVARCTALGLRACLCLTPSISTAVVTSHTINNYIFKSIVCSFLRSYVTYQGILLMYLCVRSQLH